MKLFRTTFIIVFMALSNLMLPCASLSGNNCGSPYDIELLAEDIYFLELINRARANPEA